VSRVRQDEAIRKVRERLGLTQEEFARALNVSQSTVQNWESGRTRPHRGTLARIEAVGQTPQTPRARRSRVAEETRLQLIIALETILERAPSAVIEEVSQILTDRAGKYGEPR
jgi:transcriptional regulator with XRE-family HTH domain